MSSERIGRSELFMEVARLYARRGTCRRGRVGAVAVREGRIIAAGYNGAPAGMGHCVDLGCNVVGGHCIRAAHAEANLVAWAARTGTTLEWATLYVTMSPCHTCAQILLNAGVSQIRFEGEYPHAGEMAYLKSLYVSGHFDESTGQTTVAVSS